MIKKINGYRIFMNKKLGKGAYGVVYEGQQANTETPCAVKVLEKASINSDPYLKAALISEIKIMKVLKSPNIVQLFDVMESNNNYYIIQELCDIDLENYLKQQPHKIISEKQAIQFLTEICNGFLTLVKEGILHRDLKPANIFISKKQVKIGDFGFAKKNVGGLKNHTAVGTPLYMPIEILKAIPYTSKCDIWAIGFIFYEMLHGKTPWTARSQFQLITNIQTKPLKIDDNLSDATKNFLQKSLGITQQKRISWDQVFAHPIFGNFFSAEINSNEKLENKYKKVMADIRFQVNTQNIHLKKLWENKGYAENKQLSEVEFKDFLKCIIPNIQNGQEHYFFSKMDINKDGSVSLKQLESEFLKHGIPLTSKFEQRIPFLLKRLVSVEQDNESVTDHGVDVELEKKIRSCFKRLETTLTKKNLNLFKVFLAYDGDKNGQLSIDEFSKIMKRLDASFSDDQISAIFETIDQDKSKTVEFQELNYYYSKINGIPESINLPPEYYALKKSNGGA